MAISEAEVQGKWWAGWWKEDFSWAGLAAKDVGWNVGVVYGGIHGERDLQAYWRRDPLTGVIRDDAALRAAGELVRAPDDREWHIAHVPRHWADGTPAKAGWEASEHERLAQLIAARVGCAAETATGAFCHAEAPDGRAQFSGVVLQTPLSHPRGSGMAVHVLCDQAWLLPAWETGALLGAGFRCHGALFARSRRDVPPSEAAFAGRASFAEAIFLGAAEFSRARFSGDVRFDQATFFDGAIFMDASFHEGASFVGARFFIHAGFHGVVFEGEAAFDAAIFCGGAGFNGATFIRRASFSGAHFDGGAAQPKRSSQPTILLLPAPEDGLRLANFGGARFDGMALFDGAHFGTRVRFSAASFARLASFKRLAWPERAAHWHGMFEAAAFKDLATFQGGGLRCLAAFDGAMLQGGLQLDDAAEPDANSTFRHELRQAEALNEREAALRQLEGGCRVLKQAMEKSANKTHEQMFYAFELMARRRQHKTPWWERLVSWLYEFASDYGRSIGRPIVGLVLLIPLFAACYWGLALWRRDAVLTGLSGWAVAAEFLTYSSQRVLPFGPWAITPQQIAASPVQTVLQGPTDAWFSLAIRGLGSLQSVLALILAFLAGLAIRRRFQIN